MYTLTHQALQPLNLDLEKFCPIPTQCKFHTFESKFKVPHAPDRRVPHKRTSMLSTTRKAEAPAYAPEVCTTDKPTSQGAVSQ